MTERIKDRLTGLLITALFSLLSLIAGGVGWLVTQRYEKDVQQDKEIRENTVNISKVARVVNADPDTRLEDHEELRPIYFETRGKTN